MPTPVGHVLGGLTATFLTFAAAPPRQRFVTPALLGAAAAAAVFPDFDLLLGSHRTYTHSVGAVFVVTAASIVLLRKHADGVTASVALGAAYASHLFLDWLGKDSSDPPGLTLLWPFSSTYYLSGADFFREVSRRYWRPEEFVVGNLVALGWEVTVLLPLLVVAWVWWSGRTVRAGVRL